PLPCQTEIQSPRRNYAIGSNGLRLRNRSA
ncbi:MAG: hypothetical protein RLZZ356_1499, partial [Verrucomicrobiota bacterium]